MQNRKKGWSYRKELNVRTAAGMIASGHSPDDKAAIRFISNGIMDDFERQGVVSRAESDRMSQKITLQEVPKIMKQMKKDNYRADKYLTKLHADAPTHKTVNYNEITPLDDSTCRYRGRVFGTKENLQYMPSRVRLVQIR